MPLKTLPGRPDFVHLKRQAKELLDGHRSRDPRALQRIREFHPAFREFSDTEIASRALPLSQAQLTLAREYGFASWPKLKAAVAEPNAPNRHESFTDRITDPVFQQAVRLIDAGDVTHLRGLLAGNSLLAMRRVFFQVNEYFGEPSLLEFVAENPIRNGTLPANIVHVAKVIIGAGADAPSITKTLGLVVSGRVPRECGVQVPLIELLVVAGAGPDSGMSPAIVHGEFDAVAALIRLGARVDLPAAAALNRVADVERLLEHANELDKRRALAHAAQHGRIEVVRALLANGVDPNGFNPIGCHSHSTPLHQAALRGDLETARALVEAGADPTIKDILFDGTPLGWAEHGRRREVAEYLRNLPRRAQ